MIKEQSERLCGRFNWCQPSSHPTTHSKVGGLTIPSACLSLTVSLWVPLCVKITDSTIMIIPPFLPTTSFPTQQAGQASQDWGRTRVIVTKTEGATVRAQVTGLSTSAIILHKLICWNSSWHSRQCTNSLVCAGRWFEIKYCVGYWWFYNWHGAHPGPTSAGTFCALSVPGDNLTAIKHWDWHYLQLARASSQPRWRMPGGLLWWPAPHWAL